MHRVVAAQMVLDRKIARATSQRVVDPHDQRGAVKRLEVSQSGAVRRRGQAAGSLGRGQRCSCLRVGQDTDRDGVARVPQPDGDLRPFLVDQELDQRRGVEVEGQRRWSATRSDTLPFAFTRGRAGRRDVVGLLTSPRRTNSSNGSSASIADKRAIGRPRRVTTISPPARTCSRCSLRRSCRSRTPTSYPDAGSVIRTSLAATFVERAVVAERPARGAGRAPGLSGASPCDTRRDA